MENLNTCTKQYYVVKYKSGENPHWYDESGESWSLESARLKKIEALKKMSDREKLKVKIVIRTEITNILDVDLVV